MDLYYIDYISVFGGSWMHRLPAKVKMISLAVVILLMLSVQSVHLLSATVSAVLIIAVTARLPMKIVLALMLYPSLFLVVILLSINGLTIIPALALVLRVLTITGAVVVFFLTTSYPAIFSTLSRILPGFIVVALFFSYRSMFVITDSLNNIRTTMHLRGGIDSRHPMATLQRIGMALGHFLVHSIETSDRMADALKVRGFANRIYYLGGKNE